MVLQRLCLATVGVVCIALALAGPAMAEDLRVEVYEANPNTPTQPIRPLTGVQVDLVEVDVPVLDEAGNPIPDGQGGFVTEEVIREAALTSQQGVVTFSNVGQPPNADGSERKYEVRLSTLPSYVDPVQNASEFELAGTNVFFTTTPSPEPNPQPDSTASHPPRNGEKPSAGPMTTMGSGGNLRARVPLRSRRPEDADIVGSVFGLIYRDAPPLGVFTTGVDDPVPNALVQVRYSGTYPLGPGETSQVSDLQTGANGTFEDTLRSLESTVDFVAPTVEIRFRESPFAAWSAWMDLPVQWSGNINDPREFQHKESDAQFALDAAPLEGEVNGTVALEPAPGNGRIDSGDTPLAGKTVELRSGIDDSFLRDTTTDGQGRYRFTELAVGAYRVVALPEGVDGRATVADDDRTQTVDLLIVDDVVEPPSCPDPSNPDCPCEGPDCDKECEPDNCRSGALHSVVFEGDMWLGATPTHFDIEAVLRDGCSVRSGIVDRVSLGYQGTSFPGKATGLDDVLCIEDVRLAPGGAWATLRLRMTAATSAFPDGSFGSQPKRFELTVNGRRTLACWRFVCDMTRPGGRFGTFRVHETLSRAAWVRCEGGQPPVVEPPPPPKPPHMKPPRPKPPRAKPPVKPRPRHHGKSSGKSSDKSSGKSSGKSSHKSSRKKHHKAPRWKQSKGKKKHKRWTKHRRSWSRWRRR